MRLRSMLIAILSVATTVPVFAAVTGTVITSDGQPVSGAKISLFLPRSVDERRTIDAKAPTPVATATSDSRGNFSIENPKEPVFDLHIEATGYEPAAERVLPDEEIGAIAMFAAATQSGTITAGGKPVANAIVFYGGGSNEYVTKTDDKGHYTAPEPSKWANRLVIIHPDFAVFEEGLGLFGTPAKKTLDRTLDPGVAITGKVLGLDGATPVADAAIYVDGWQITKSGADGSFTVPHAKKDWAIVEARVNDRVGTRAHTKTAVTIKLTKAATVAGSVSDAKSKLPLAGVEVRLMEPPAMGAPGRIGVVRTGFTNAKGVFNIAGVAPGVYQINPTRPGYVTPNINVSVTAGQTATKALFANPRAKVTGTVTDENKRPIAGARVTPRNATREAGFNMMNFAGFRFGGDAVAYSGPDGHYVARNVPIDSDIQMDATRKGFPTGSSSTLHLNASEKKAGVTITIPQGIALTGKVLDQNGKPLSGVGVETVESSRDAFGGARRMIVNLMQQDRNDEMVHTGSDGTFTIRVKEGTYDVIFKREGFSSKTVRAQQINAAAKPIEVTLEPGVEITGRVTRNGVGIEGVNINVMNESGGANAVTASDGSFRLEDLTAGSMMLLANKREDFIQEMRPVNAPAQNVEIQVRAGGRVTGHVTDKSNNPVTSFQAGISTSRSGGGMVIQTPPILKSFTTDDGSFTLENVPAGPLQLVVTAPGFTTARVSGLNLEEGKALDDVKVELDTGVKLTGRVTGPNGAPVAGVTVREDTGASGNRVMRINPADSVTVTDANGEYTLDALEAGDKTFAFNHPDYLAESKQITLSGSSARLDVSLSTGVRLTGSVVSEAGPVSDAIVNAMSAANSGFGKSARTDGGGNFQMEGLAPGHYTITATKNGYANGTLRDFDVASGVPAQIRMTSGGTIMGHVTGLSPKELENANVFANGPTGQVNGPVDSSGNYRIDGAPTGTVRLFARSGGIFGSSGKTSPQKSIQVDPGATVTADIEFKTATVIRGHVTRDGQPMATAGVTFIPRAAQAQTSASAQTDSNGNYEVNGLDDATYTVQVVDFQRTTPFTTSYDVKGSGTFDIDIKSASVHGRVLDASTGTPLADTRIEIHNSGTDAIFSSRVVSTDPSGNFTIDNVARGTYEVKADHEGYGHDIRTLTVGDSVDDLEFKLSPSSGVTLTVVDARDNRQLGANIVQIIDASGKNVDFGPGFRFTNSTEPIKLTLAAGTYRVTLNAMGYATQTFTITSPSNYTARMSPGGTLRIRSSANTITRGRLIDSSGQPYVRGFVGAGGIFTIDASPGETVLQNVAAGSYQLEILGNGDAVVNRIPVNVVDGPAPTVVEVK